MIEKVGAGVSKFQPGMRVVAANSAPCTHCFYCLHDAHSLCEDLLFLNGAYAQFIRVPARIVNINLFEIPDNVSFTHAAVTEPLACVVHGIDVCDMRLSDTVVINGSGAIGLMLCRLAALRGARVIVCDPASASAGAWHALRRRGNGAGHRRYGPGGRRSRR